ncbi:hypothetical protein ACWENS_09860 [Streptomyces sp. NPDC004532]
MSTLPLLLSMPCDGDLDIAGKLAPGAPSGLPSFGLLASPCTGGGRPEAVAQFLDPVVRLVGCALHLYKLIETVRHLLMLCSGPRFVAPSRTGVVR